MESSVHLTHVCDKELVQEKISLHERKGWIPVKGFRTMDEEDSMDGMEDEESKNPLAFLGLQRSFSNFVFICRICLYLFLLQSRILTGLVLISRSPQWRKQKQTGSSWTPAGSRQGRGRRTRWYMEQMTWSASLSLMSSLSSRSLYKEDEMRMRMRMRIR